MAAPVRVAGPGDGDPPVAPLPLIGRESELRELGSLLEDGVRLLTLAGIGGIGKTQLALALARELRDGARRRTRFVSLEGVRDPLQVPWHVAACLALPTPQGGDPLEALAHGVGTEELLLVLDEFEELAGGADVLLAMLRACPRLQLVVTSREPLDLTEEHLYPVDGLALPAGASSTLEQAAACSALRLFVRAAKRSDPRFVLNAANVGAVASICRLVGGAPLGIELAAGLMRVLPPARALAELRANLDVLQSRARNRPDRHANLRVVFERTWRLLSGEQQRVLRRSSAFRGGFTLAAASEVAGASVAVLAALVDRALVRVSPDGRYELHPLVRQYTRERLAEQAPEEIETTRRHLEHFLALAREAMRHRRDAARPAWSERLVQEHENLREALRYAETHRHLELGLGLADALSDFWRGHVHEGYAWATRLLELLPAEPSTLRIRALRLAGLMALLHGDPETARAHLEACLAAARELTLERTIGFALRDLGNLAKIEGRYEAASGFFEQSLDLPAEGRHRANALNNLGDVARVHGRYAEARAYHERALGVGRQLGEPRTVAHALNGLGRFARDLGDPTAARARFEESLAVARSARNSVGAAVSLGELGLLAREAGDHARACRLHGESLRLKWASGSLLYVASSFEAVAGLRAEAGEPLQAAHLWGAAEALREAGSAPLPPDERARYERDVAAARALADEASFEATWAQGRATDVSKAAAFALDLLPSS